ncbi:helix-turn-helix transcriptional regulator [Sporosarcina sp. resist]|uniref:helix-turn-helix transcriptional regulator n=1 Tax=Sporosarcina sp. resist TaxID=2762563 RepID=UPI00164E06C1|nr:helix-turn-helix transcriptional regulator [Sporosarcina sp. resist]QNK86475.1 helix-turn-helix transcriptional regulator [Sporosarcina sp. resist]
MREVLIEKRQQKELTQLEVAEKIGVSEVFVRKIEKSDRNPSVETMLKFESLYSTSMRLLFPDIFQVSSDTKCIKSKIVV